MESKKLKVAIYCRTANENKEEIKDQEMYLTKICNLLQYEIVNVYRDDGFSGRNTNRPAYKKMLNDLKNRKFKSILTISIDRICRDISELEYFIKLITEYECTFKSIKDDIDLDTPQGKLFARAITIMDTYGAKLENE